MSKVQPHCFPKIETYAPQMKFSTTLDKFIIEVRIRKLRWATANAKIILHINIDDMLKIVTSEMLRRGHLCKSVDCCLGWSMCTNDQTAHSNKEHREHVCKVCAYVVLEWLKALSPRKLQLWRECNVRNLPLPKRLHVTAEHTQGDYQMEKKGNLSEYKHKEYERYWKIQQAASTYKYN